MYAEDPVAVPTSFPLANTSIRTTPTLSVADALIVAFFPRVDPEPK
jgi:hypothetical protein